MCVVREDHVRVASARLEGTRRPAHTARPRPRHLGVLGPWGSSRDEARAPRLLPHSWLAEVPGGGAPRESGSVPSAASARKPQQAARPAGGSEGPVTSGAWAACGPPSGLATRASSLASAIAWP